jgi:hypothetical protein
MPVRRKGGLFISSLPHPQGSAYPELEKNSVKVLIEVGRVGGGGEAAREL